MKSRRVPSILGEPPGARALPSLRARRSFLFLT
jgi:hypothetical protein